MGNLLIQKYFPKLDIENLSMQAWTQKVAEVRYLQNQEEITLANAIARAFSQ